MFFFVLFFALSTLATPMRRYIGLIKCINLVLVESHRVLLFT
jgi:hypothetical protein